MSVKEFLSIIAIAISVIAFIPYLHSILKGHIRPHVFSWIIWGITTSIVFVAEFKNAGGAGAWPIGFSASLTLIIALIAVIKRNDVSITLSDWLFFIVALSSVPLWYFTSDALWAIIILTTVDLLGFGPTLRKAYTFPKTESPVFFSLIAMQYILVILALEHYSVTTLLFPVAISSSCLLVTLLISYRRFLVRLKS